ncbi:MAG: thiamine diphosphokinase [Clostridia bacterium]|nr:thiamine diphosphokinase [Clostridia bacterium]
MIKCAVFDADGTLIDSMGVWVDADKEYLSKKDREFDPETYKKFNNMTFAESISYVKRHYGFEDTEEQIKADILKIVGEKYENDVKAKDGVARLLQRLADVGIKMAVATANDKELVCRALYKNGLFDYFSHIITCDETGCGKNDAAVFIHTAKLLGYDPSETLVVEDSEQYVKAARDAGFLAVHIDEIDKLGFGHRCAIVGAADIGRYDIIKEYLKDDDCFIYCDAGLRHEKALGKKADIIVGDFDSTENPNRETETIVLPHEKDDTDTVYAVKEAMRRGFSEFLLIGVIGGRIDHTLGNIAILNMLHSAGCHGMIVDDHSEIEIISDKPAYVSDKFPYFSLLNITGVCRKVTVKNALYPLDNAQLTTDFPLGVSNEPLKGKTAEITVADGRALLVRVREG